MENAYIKNGRTRLRNIVLAAMFAAVTAVLSQTAIPLPSGVPVTLQVFAVALCGFCLGSKWGTVSVAVYILLGTIGVPVFSGFKGGAAVLAGITGGYIWGFVLMVFLCGLGKEFGFRGSELLMGVAGVLLCHLCGIFQVTLINQSSLWQNALVFSVPYLVKDFISAAAAAALSKNILKRIG